VLIVAILAVIIGNIVVHGATRGDVGVHHAAAAAGTDGGRHHAGDRRHGGAGDPDVDRGGAARRCDRGLSARVHASRGLNLAWRRFRVSKRVAGRRKLFFRAMSALLATVTRSAVANLAGVPSIVFGLFGLGFFIQFIGRNIDRVTQPPGEVLWGQGSLLWAACTLALLTLPTVIVATEEALRTVPQDLREASLALGATQWETIRRVVLPSSLSGIMTGAILGISRGAGEVAPISRRSSARPAAASRRSCARSTG
jgi:ABC-type amino acid transport system permease subunit